MVDGPRKPLTPDDVARIAARDDVPVLRNLAITQAYFHVSHDFARVIGIDNANWCTYAVWASKTAGDFVRMEEVPSELLRLLHEAPESAAHSREIEAALGRVHEDARLHPQRSGFFGLIDDIIDQVTDLVAVGNKMVFSEIAAVFARFVATFEGDAGRPPDPAKLARFVEGLSTAPVQPDELVFDDRGIAVGGKPRGGQGLLRDASDHYFQAMHDRDRATKAQHVLLANALVGLHEQTRLQSYIKASINAPISTLFGERTHRALEDRLGGGPHLDRAHAVVDRLLSPLSDHLAKVWAEFSTLTLMKLDLPDGPIYLGRDIPAPSGEPLFPADLARIQETELASILRHYGALDPLTGASILAEAESQIQSLLGRFGVKPRTLFGTASTDWEVLSNRMRFIFTLFRSRQQDLRMFSAPFTPDQMTAISEWRLPHGSLS